MKISIIGSGYVGLVTGVCFAEVGIDVVCVDIDQEKISNLQKGISPIYEPGIEEMIARNLKNGRLSFTTKIQEALQGCEVLFIAVGTPPGEDGSADTQYVLNVAKDIGKYMQNDLLVVTKSTVPVGTSVKVRQAIDDELKKRNQTIEYGVASNPEFLKEGAAIEDFMKPERIIIGVESEKAKEILLKLYRPFTLNGHPVISMDITSAELTKYVANAMLATRISFMNDIANLCEILGADINMIRKGIGSDSRIGSKFLYSGIGYGGSCFPKDVKALVNTANSNGYDLRILKSVEDVNKDQKEILFHKVLKHFNGDIKGKTFAIWGLSFKPQTDDMREAPSIVIINKLLEEGANVKAYDPVAMKEAEKIFGNRIQYSENLTDVLDNAEALLILTEWYEFRYPNLKELKSKLKNPLIFDGRNIFNPELLKNEGFTYYSIGLKV